MLKAGKAKEGSVKGEKGGEELMAGAKERKYSQDSDDENRVPVPTFQTSFGDAIQAALDSYDKGGGRLKTCIIDNNDNLF